MMDQGDEHACTGFGLAAVAHYLIRRHAPQSAHVPVSARMMYEMAKRYDEWTGVNYQGSSARGAVKGWHKHGVCAAMLWPYVPDQIDRELYRSRRKDAAERPLLRTSVWRRPISRRCERLSRRSASFSRARRFTRAGESRSGTDTSRCSEDHLGTHAFAFVGYDSEGFWLQNSKGTGWGKRGFGYLA